MKRATTLFAAAGTLGSALTLGPAPAHADTVTPDIAAIGTIVTASTGLNTRIGPSSASSRIGALTNGTTIAISCRVAGEFITGSVTNTGYWDRLADNSFISDAFVQRESTDIPKCATTAIAIPAVSGIWMLPVRAGLVSGFRTVERPVHDGVDLGAARNTAIRSASAGTVIRVVCNVSRGSCDVDGSRSLRGCGWYVEVQHADGIVTRYCHMIRQPSVAVGQVVGRGTVLGHVGTSGSSSGPHLHFEVHVGAPATRANAVSPIDFMSAVGLTFGSA
ncbi:hypothetical protein GCM10010435_20080 [Winogradskya consettensis]|uniref:M23ase beta-sheet core domain-containing protein n=1 Tax=Winogradskya consettensis TaxID=113560 RepID=A0A919SV13_9ACTN|nr:peptidoglycan DD-metalloendopeptidase family protein [Actinoplanes consettensis]GIM78154.1 hypothetical protein Aco04nite_58970 [Actinoplanes consettensis]